ncbi:hemerythrin domain-containing protein [Nocardioides sp. CN2-186]|uniref:hemerythrin domain-containing protein n=1 Tax=Nocardioides tweenelious TaxID=3156607 RepID=UPI0032B48667
MNTTPAPQPQHRPDQGVDIRDMIVVHTALLREFRLAPDAVRRATPGSRALVRDVTAHLRLLCALMHHHHTGEDELLWPVLGPRLTDAERTLLEVAEAQHAGIDQSLHRVDQALTAWTAGPAEAEAAELVDALGQLHVLLREHLEAEERHLLPLAAAHLTEEEWHRIGEAGAAGVPKRDLLLVFGMFAYEGDPEVLAQMLQAAPPPARVLVPRLAPRVYARHAARIHGNRRP